MPCLPPGSSSASGRRAATSAGGAGPLAARQRFKAHLEITRPSRHWTLAPKSCGGGSSHCGTARDLGVGRPPDELPDRGHCGLNLGALMVAATRTQHRGAAADVLPSPCENTRAGSCFPRRTQNAPTHVCKLQEGRHQCPALATVEESTASWSSLDAGSY